MLTEEKGCDLISYDGIRDEGGDAMSRVERHKDEYAKEDRMAVESGRSSAGGRAAAGASGTSASAGRTDRGGASK